MSEQTMSPEMMAQLAQMLATQKPAGNAWGQSSAMPVPNAVLIPVEVDTPMGKVRTYLSYGPEHGSPEGIMALLQSLANAGVPIAAWQKQQSGWGGGGGDNGGSRWGGNRGGYGRRY